MTSTPSAIGSRSDISVAPPRHFSAGNQRRVSIDLKKIAGNFCLRAGERCRCSPSLTLTGEDHVLSTHFSQKPSQITLQVLRSWTKWLEYCVRGADWRKPGKHSQPVDAPRSDVSQTTTANRLAGILVGERRARISGQVLHCPTACSTWQPPCLHPCFVLCSDDIPHRPHCEIQRRSHFLPVAPHSLVAWPFLHLKSCFFRALIQPRGFWPFWWFGFFSRLFLCVLCFLVSSQAPEVCACLGQFQTSCAGVFCH
ncbi:hypothetical protein B0J18DRAFT_120835 [Chaetomium sp. MPI-SDFR-AT-0129]|nr:hypothetical protein B0J18DRAFT_120835 [Chaetomium sp. MPI-SDFR-AT-0129]